jgi:DNA adenine methylase
MILSRIGNKRAIASKIYQLFPKHDIYIEPFFGAGGMFFNKPKSAHNFLNDLDEDVYNLFLVLVNKKNEFIDVLEKTPIHKSLFDYWVKNRESDPVLSAVRFIVLSNFSYLGKGDTLCLGADLGKSQILQKLDSTLKYFGEAKLTNVDFEKMMNIISLDPEEKNRAFIYADPPYVKTAHNYKNGFKLKDAQRLINCLIESNLRFAYSEFDNPDIINMAKNKNLNIQYVCRRQSLKSVSNEILITNYNQENTLFD